MFTIPINVKIGESTIRLAANFREAGSELLLFIHGLGCSKEAFEAAWDMKALEKYSLLAFDLPGFGASPKPEDFSYSLLGQAEVVAQVIGRVSSYRIHFVANSWGPIIGLQLSAEILGSLASFVNLEGRMVIEDVGNAKKAAALPFTEFEQTFWPEMKQKTSHEPKTAYRLDDALPQAYYNGAKSIVEIVGRGELPQKFMNLTCPKVYVYGDQNKHLKSLAAIGDTKKVAISNAGHFMMKDNPEEFYQKLAEFLVAST